MRKKTLITTVALFAATAVCFAAGPFIMGIGSGAGSLNFTDVYSNGNIDGDDGTFDPGVGAPNTTIWNNCFALVDAGTNAIVFADTGFGAHTAQMADGTVVNSATQITNNGMTFPGIANVTANLAINLTQPVAGDTARMTWAWTFNNAGGSPVNLRLIWFLDVDSYLNGSAFDDELVGFAPAVDGLGIAAGIGENSAGAVDMNLGVFAECSKAPARIFGITSNQGSSYYWSNSTEFAGIAPEVAFEIPAAVNYTIQGDTASAGVALENADLDFNGVTDVPLANDCGVAFQINLTIPAAGSDSVSCIATWGKNTTLTGLAASERSWNLY